MLSMLGKIFSRRHVEIYLVFFLESRFWHFMQIVLSPQETICMKCQILFSGKNKKKNCQKCHLLNFLPSMLNVTIGLNVGTIRPDHTNSNIYPNYSDRRAKANSVGPAQMLQDRNLIWIYIVTHPAGFGHILVVVQSLGQVC